MRRQLGFIGKLIGSALHPAPLAGPVVLATMLVLTAVESSPAFLSDNLNGGVSLSGVRADSDDDSRSTLRQEYTANWYRNFSDYLTFRTTLRYYKFTYDRSQQTGLFRKELQPTAQLLWNHPLLTISAEARRREAEGTSARDELTNESYDVSLRTRSHRWPLLTVRYNRNHLIGQPGVAGRNILDNRWNAGLDYHTGRLSSAYRLTQNNIENRVTGLRSGLTHHNLRLSYSLTALRDRRLRVATDYSFSYQKQTDRVPTTETLLHLIQVSAGLYGDRESAEIGQLERVAALTDGNTATPVQPVIDIGPGLANRHLGVDLGFQRQITALYIYTNTLSDEQLGWQVYISEDNFTWEAYALNPAIRFDASLNRYEVKFPTVSARYVKAINSGFNQAEQVYITEIQAVAEVPASGEVTESHNAHIMNVSSSFRATERWTTSADLSYQGEPSVGLRGKRDNVSHSGAVRFQQRTKFGHSLRWQASLRATQGELADLKDYSLMYHLKYEPLPELDATWSATARRSYADDLRDSQDLRMVAQATGTPIYGLKLSTEISYGRSHRYALDRSSNTWNRRITIDARVNRSLETDFSYMHQSSKTRQTGDHLQRDQYALGFRLRLTLKMSVRGSIDWSRGDTRYLAQEFGAGWNLSKAISASFLYRLSDDNGGYRSVRYSARLNCRLSGRSSAYVGYIDNDFSQAAGSHTKSVQVGMRTGF